MDFIKNPVFLTMPFVAVVAAFFITSAHADPAAFSQMKDIQCLLDPKKREDKAYTAVMSSIQDIRKLSKKDAKKSQEILATSLSKYPQLKINGHFFNDSKITVEGALKKGIAQISSRAIRDGLMDYFNDSFKTFTSEKSLQETAMVLETLNDACSSHQNTPYVDESESEVSAL